MAMTDKKIKFAKAKLSGKNNTEAAILAGYSQNGAKQQGSRLAGDSDVMAFIEKHKNIDQQFVPKTTKGIDPLEYLLDVIANEDNEQDARIAAAKAALPYIHGKIGDVGKKETQKDTANSIASGSNGSGRFATAQPPKRLN